MKIIKRKLIEIIEISYSLYEEDKLREYIKMNGYQEIGFSWSKNESIVKVQKVLGGEENINENIEL